ncbi:hypothetical protein [Rhodopila sp.]|uniref:hypothetical protein n=1 Tax=Rhodopila sp. TaxID=2480087 RepID=UPI003D146FD0
MRAMLVIQQADPERLVHRCFIARMSRPAAEKLDVVVLLAHRQDLRNAAIMRGMLPTVRHDLVHSEAAATV